MNCPKCNEQMYSADGAWLHEANGKAICPVDELKLHRDTNEEGEGRVVIPAWMNPVQVEAINKLYQRSPDGSKDRREFFTRVSECGIGSDRYAGINWCNMFVGIEPDGYTHT